MNDKIQLTVQSRSAFGNKVKKLRTSGFLPANIYGAQIESVAIEVPSIELKKLVKTIGESEVIDIQIDGEKETRPVLIGHVQKDPVTYEPIHVDFRQIDLSKEVTVEVEIRFEGESPATKVANVILLELMEELEVTALPGNLPSEITVDVSGLENVGDSITVGDLVLPEGVIPSAEPDQFVCKIDMIQVREEESEEETTDLEGEETEESSGEVKEQEETETVKEE